MPSSLRSTMGITQLDEPGDKLVISGTIFKANGKTPYPNVILYAYHTDSEGYYSKKEQRQVFRNGTGAYMVGARQTIMDITKFGQ